MAQWQNDDSAANSVLWGPTRVKLPANSANRDALFGNNTGDAFITGATVGTYGVADNETTYDLFKIIGATPGANSGTAVLITSNATTQFTANLASSTNAVINVESVKVSTYAVNTAAGEDFVTGDIVALDEGEGLAATFRVTANATGNVESITLIKEGSYANSSDVPGANPATTNVTGIGTALVLDVTLGVQTLSLETEGSYSSSPGSSNFQLTADADQTGANVLVNLTTSKYNDAQAVTHSGHVLTIKGSGGRAGRTQSEVLVACGITGDDEDTAFPNT